MQWRSYRTSILLAITLTLLLSAFWFFPSLAFIIFISLLLQLLLAPPVEFLCRKKVPRAISAGIVLIAFVALLITMLGVISRTFIPTFTRFVRPAAALPEPAEYSIPAGFRVPCQ